MKRLVMIVTMMMLVGAAMPIDAACVRYNWRALAVTPAGARIPNYYVCGTTAELAALTTAVESDMGWDSDKNYLYTYTGAAWQHVLTAPSGDGFVKIIGGGWQGSAALVTFSDAQEVDPNQGTTTTVLHGNAAGQPSFGAVVSADIVDATLVYADFQNIAALSVMGRGANTSGVAADVTGSAGQVLRVSAAPTLGFGSIDLSSSAAVGTSILPVANGGTGLSTGAALKSVLAGDYTNATASMTNTALSVTVVSGTTYLLEAALFVADSTAADGVAIDFDGGAATATTFIVSCGLIDGTGASAASQVNGTSVALATDINASAITRNVVHLYHCNGTFVPSSSSTLIVRASQNAHTTGTLTMWAGSWLRLEAQ